MKKNETHNQAKKVFLLDGHALCYRAFYAIRELTNSKGESTNAIYGVETTLRKILREEKPDYIAFAFDVPKPTFRHDKYEKYKATRKPMDEDLRDQIPKIKELMRAHGIPVYEKEGYEADDILGTMAAALKSADTHVYLVTSDKDAMQLVDDKVFIYSPHKDGQILKEKDVREKFEGLGPEQVIEIMALTGDSSDNIPGVPRIGPKTALTLIKEFGSVQGIYKNLHKVKSETQRKLLEENQGLAEMSRELVTIDCATPIDFKLEDLAIREPDAAKLAELYTRYEFRNFLKELEAPGPVKQEKREYHTVTTESALTDLARRLAEAEEFAVDTETTSENPHVADLVALSFSFRELEAYCVPVSSAKHQGGGLPLETVLRELKPVLESAVKKIGQNIKYDWIVLKQHGVNMGGLSFDTMVASYLNNPAKRNHNLDDLSYEYLGVVKIPTQELLGKGKAQIRMDAVPGEKLAEYACEDADCTFRLKNILQPLLERNQVQKLFDKLEMPLVQVLAEMEINGVKIDTGLLAEFSREAGEQLEKLTEKIYEIAGGEFNVNSTQQLSEVLFEKLKLAPVRKTKTGYSTDVEVLEKLAVEHDLPKLILEYRENMKLKSTYFDALPGLADSKELVHTSFNQTVAATGRLSSSEPNLQNIPIKIEAGRKIRKAFVPRAKGRKLLSADYSQIELRFLAHFSGDQALVKAFQEDTDVHTFTACLLYGVKSEKVTWEMRNVAKTINFSIIYGKTPFGLSQDLQIAISQADAFIHSYFERYPKVKDYLESQKEHARKHGFVTTILGRRAYFPDILSKNFNLRGFAERAAINAPLQGSAADLIKLAMINIQHALKREKMKALMILQVHDELVFDFPEEEEKALSQLVRAEMEKALTLKVPLKADLYVGDSWYKER